ncbi:MAG: oligosaccharide flippase family protein [Phycisphaerae bacterium]|jgi:O-antigen/teichoic acid export membrane protein
MQTTDDDNSKDSSERQVEAVGSHVGAGMTWMMIATVAARSSTFVAQVIVGRWLGPREFGLYFTAIAISGFLTVCREAGTGAILMHRGRDAYEENAGQAFWMGLAYDVAILAITCALAWPIASFYKAEELAWMLVVLSAALIPNAVSNVLFVRLRFDLRFKAFSVINTLSSVARQVSLVLFVVTGMTHMSFAWSAFVSCVVDAVCVWWVTRDAVWTRPPRIERWRSWAGSSLWLMLTSLANFGMDFAPFIVLGRILGGDSDIIGYYSFAYNITAQIGVLLAFNSVVVLTPILQRLAAQPERQSQAALRSLRSLMLAGCVATMGLAAVFGPLEHLLFRGKFDAAVEALVILALFYPWRITLGVTSSLLNAKGEFGRLTVLTMVECVGLFAVSLAAGMLTPTPVGISLWTGGWVMFVRIISTMVTFRPLGTSPLAVLRTMMPAWVLCTISLGTTILISRRFTIDAAILGWCTDRFPEPWGRHAADVGCVLIHGAICATLMYLLIRPLLRSHLVDLLAVTPARIRPLLSRFLLIREMPAADQAR